MAMKNVLRNKSGFAITLISMCLGSVMFLASSFYSDLMEDQQKKLDEVSKVNTDFKISMIPIKPMYAGYSAKDIDNIRSINGVEDVGEIRNLYARMFLKENQILDKEYFKEENEWTYNKDVLAGLLVDCGNGDKILKSGVYGYNDTLLKKLDKHLAKGNVNLKEMNNEEVAIAMVPKNNGKYTVGVDIGDKLKVTFREDGISSEEYFKMTDTGGKYITKEFKIVGIVNELVDYSDYYVSDNSVNLVLSNKQFEKFSGYKNAVGIVNELVDYSDYYVDDRSVNLVLSKKQFEKFSGYKNAQIVNIEMNDNANRDKVAKQILTIANRTSGNVVLSKKQFEKFSGYKNAQIVNIEMNDNANRDKVAKQILTIANRTSGNVLADLTEERMTLAAMEENKQMFINAIIGILFLISMIVNIEMNDNANREKVAKQILTIANRTSGNVFADLTEERMTLAAMEENKQMFINAIIGILFLISIINIVNNIKYSMVSRRAEFGIIRAVGADNKMFR